MTERQKNSVTLRDVAQRAGVNATTVSVVLNGNRSGTRVSAATRERILGVAHELGYRPNFVARSMKQRRMNTIGVVDIMHRKGLNLYFLEVLNGILEKAAQYEQNTTVFTVSNWNEEEKILQFCDGRVDGLVLVGPQLRAEFAESLFQQIPFVALHSNISLPVATSLGIDDAQGGYVATRHLIELGHRRIFLFAGPEHYSGAQYRVAGYRRAMEEVGLPVADNGINRGAFESASGYERMKALLADTPEQSLPTAIVCGNDAIASGVIQALNESHISVPKTISVVGFDDSFTARMTQPPLTTVRQPFRELGQHAVELLWQQIEETGNAPIPLQELFPLELIVRGSTAPPRE